MEKLLEIERSIIRHYAVLDWIGCQGIEQAAGYLRAAYSNEETAAMSYIEEQGVILGAASAWDAVGNLCLSWPGEDQEFIEFASHLDTVPNGGNFDGVAGVVTGLVAIESLLKSGQKLRKGLRLRIWRGEEGGTFNAVYTGSLAAFGKFKPNLLKNKFRGISLAEAIQSQAYDPAFIEQGRSTISQAEIDSIAAHIELHIEQGNFLEVNDCAIGVVTSIRGPRRLRVTLTGDFDHSGATPMGLNYRRDANLALGYILVALDQLANQELQTGADLVQTVGVINAQKDFNDQEARVYENAVPKVSGFAYFCLDMRSAVNAYLEEYCEKARQVIQSTAERFNVGVQIELLGSSSALEAVDSGIQAALLESAKDLNFSVSLLPSGAGHDAAVVGSQKRSDGQPIPVGMLFIPCRKGKSHCPEEYATTLALAKGAQTMALAASKLS